MTKCSQMHAQYAFRSILKQKIAIKLKKHQSEKQKSAKKKHKKSTFQLNQAQKQATRKSSKNPKLHKKTSPNSRENRKVGNTGQYRKRFSVWPLS